MGVSWSWVPGATFCRCAVVLDLLCFPFGAGDATAFSFGPASKSNSVLGTIDNQLIKQCEQLESPLPSRLHCIPLSGQQRNVHFFSLLFLWFNIIFLQELFALFSLFCEFELPGFSFSLPFCDSAAATAFLLSWLAKLSWLLLRNVLCKFCLLVDPSLDGAGFFGVANPPLLESLVFGCLLTGVLGPVKEKTIHFFVTAKCVKTRGQL